MSHSQETKDFLNDLADKLRQLQFEAEEHYTSLKHPLPFRDESEWDRVIAAVMAAANAAQWHGDLEAFDGRRRSRSQKS
jgi:hypothetical protein